MPASPLTDVATRLLANVEADSGDLADDVLRVPVSSYLDPAQFERELELVFRRQPLVVALSVDLAKPGDHHAVEIAGRPVVAVRGEDGVARAFLNVCPHRGAPVTCNGFGSGRRLTCPYHAWSFDTAGHLVGVPHRELFGDVGVAGLVELPTAERAGLVFAVLTPGAPMEIDEFLGDMASALELLELDKLHRHDAITELVSGNWKTTADGYLDGYHIGYLHRENLGLRSLSKGNTFDCFGPHVRVGFPNKAIVAMKDAPVSSWTLTDAMSLVHYVFPNVSISGQPGRATMVSRILPGPAVGESVVQQYQYSREPLDTSDKRAEMETRRKLYAAVTGDEDFRTVLDINRSLPAFAGESFLFGRNEKGNQNLHRWVARLTA